MFFYVNLLHVNINDFTKCLLVQKNIKKYEKKQRWRRTMKKIVKGTKKTSKIKKNSLIERNI